MFLSHFQLGRRPFDETLETAAYVPLASRETGLRRLCYGLEQGSGVLIAHGPPGAGKTMLARRLLDLRPGPAVHLSYPALPIDHLLAFLADEWGVLPLDGRLPDRAVTLKALRDFLAAARKRGERPILVIDEAHLIHDPHAAECLRLLLNFSSAGPPDLTLVLVGSTELLLSLSPALADRIAACALVGPLDEEETAQYLATRLQRAGGNPGLFTPAAIARLHLAADGLPRRLNRLADLALLVAGAADRPTVDVDAVLLAVREISAYAAAG